MAYLSFTPQLRDLSRLVENGDNGLVALNDKEFLKKEIDSEYISPKGLRILKSYIVKACIPATLDDAIKGSRLVFPTFKQLTPSKVSLND